MQQELASTSHEVDTSGLPIHVALKVEITTAGIRQFAVAERIGMSEGQLSKLLGGRRPIDDEMAIRIRRAIKELAA